MADTFTRQEFSHQRSSARYANNAGSLTSKGSGHLRAERHDRVFSYCCDIGDVLPDTPGPADLHRLTCRVVDTSFDRAVRRHDRRPMVKTICLYSGEQTGHG